MSFDAAIRHVMGSRSTSAAAPAPAAAPRRSDAGIIFGIGTLIAFGAWLIQGAKERPELGEESDEPADELEEPPCTGSVVIETTGQEVADVARPALPAVPLEVRRIVEAGAWGQMLAAGTPRWALDADLWRSATVAVRPRWSEHPRPWAVVTHVYHAMGGRLS
jgi:hypothetical protein